MFIVKMLLLNTVPLQVDLLLFEKLVGCYKPGGHWIAVVCLSFIFVSVMLEALH
jgi:hypothetical protein